jgi:hypothetical protein
LSGPLLLDQDAAYGDWEAHLAAPSFRVTAEFTQAQDQPRRPGIAVVHPDRGALKERAPEWGAFPVSDIANHEEVGVVVAFVELGTDRKGLTFVEHGPVASQAGPRRHGIGALARKTTHVLFLLPADPERMVAQHPAWLRRAAHEISLQGLAWVIVPNRLDVATVEAVARGADPMTVPGVVYRRVALAQSDPL